jgi:hypothetical protein
MDMQELEDEIGELLERFWRANPPDTHMQINVTAWSTAKVKLDGKLEINTNIDIDKEEL